MKTRTLLVPVLFGLLSAAAACGGDDRADDSNGSGSSGSADVDSGATPSGDGGSSSGTSGDDAEAGPENADAGPTAPAHDAYVLLAGNRISGLHISAPGDAETPWAVSNVAPTVALVALQWRPRNGYLYALGFSAVYNELHLYAINVASKSAMQVGKKSTIKPALKGKAFAFDFNAAYDRMDVVTNAGEAFVMSPASGSIRDDDGNPDNGLTPQPEISGGSSKLAWGTAFTGNMPGESTARYTIAGNSLYLHTINTNVLTNALPLANVVSVAGFDIPLDVTSPGPSEAAISGKGVAVASMAGSAVRQLVNIDLTNGNVIPLGALPFEDVLGFTLVPADAPRRFIGIHSGDTAWDFYEGGSVIGFTIHDIAPGESLVGITSHPHTGQIFALGVSVGTKKGSLYVLDGDTAVRVGPTGAIAFVGTDGKAVTLPVPGQPGSTNWGFDIDPTTGYARVVTTTGLHFRVDTKTGLPLDGDENAAGVNTDAKLSGAATELNAIAHTNDVGAASTTVYGLSTVTKALHVVSPSGVVGAPAPLTLDGMPLAVTDIGGFDIAPSGGNGYALLTVGGTQHLYELNLSTGAAKVVQEEGYLTSIIVSR